MADQITPLGHLDDGLTPVFLFNPEHSVTQEKFIKAVYEQTGEPQFYLVGLESVTVKNSKGVQSAQYQPKFFLVNYSRIGYSCDPIELSKFNDVKDTFGRTVKDSAAFSLPKMPRKMVAEIDAFFRYVYDKLKTEAIVILTYDPDLEGEDRDSGLGWGYQIPEQENTAGHCNYQADSVIEHMEESAYIAGSCHSHPMMSAFCSGTDKADQEDFPGLHVTFGWGDKGSDPGITNHHCEFQLGPQAWSLKPSQIFADPPPIDVPEGVVSLADERVSKSVPAPKQSHQGSWPGNYGNNYTGANRQHGSGSKTTGKDNKVAYYEPRNPKAGVKFNVPEEIEHINFRNASCILVWSPLLEAKEIRKCPCCDAAMPKQAVEAFRCRECLTYVHGLDKDFEDIVTKRKESKTLPTAGLSLRDGQHHSVWYVVENYEDDDHENENTVLEVDCIHQGKNYEQVTKKKAKA